MLGKHKGDAQEQVSTSPLSATMIDGPVLYTTDAAWATFEVPTQRWSFRSDRDRLTLIQDIASRTAALRGRELHWRITSRPTDAGQWARGLADRTPCPLPGYAGHLDGVRDHLSAGTGAEKRIYLGVQVASRPMGARLMDSLRGQPGKVLQSNVDRQVAILSESLAGEGLRAELVGSAGMEWLYRRSVELGLPARGDMSPVADGVWGPGDLHEIDESVYHEVAPFADAVPVIGRGARSGVRSWVSVLTVGRVDEIEVADPSRLPWLADVDALPFPTEWSIRLRVLDGAAATDAIGRKLLVARDMQKHYREHDLDEPLALERQARQARSIEDEMTTGQEAVATRVHGWYRLAVWGESKDECLERARMVVDRYRKRQVTIAHPKGQYGLLREFIPGEPLSNTAYQRRLPAMYFASGVPMASSTLGDGVGPYIGNVVGGAHKSVFFDTHFATEIRETSGLVPIIGSPGSGKSVLEALITYEAVRRGITSVMLDPSGPLARLCDLPELRGRSRHIDLTAAPSGALGPFRVVPEPRPEDYATLDLLEEARVLARLDRKQLALDIAVMLLPAGLAARSRTRMLITEAVRSTNGSPMASLWTVVKHLEAGDADARDIAAYLRDMSEMPLARLFFPNGPEGDGETQATLTVLTMPGLILPPSSVPREHWSTSEQLAVPLLHLASWYATRTIYGRPRNERKLVALDETHFLGEWGAGRALFTRLGRDSRKWNTCVLAASQNPKDVLGMEVANFVSAAFVGRIEDEESVAMDALEMLKVPRGVGYEGVLARLSPRAMGAERSGVREFVMRDVDGNVDRMRVDLDHLPGLLAALDTTAAPVGARLHSVGAA